MDIARILVPIDFSPSSTAALELALKLADECGAEVEVVHVWRPQQQSGIFAETPQGRAMERLLSTAECEHCARVSGRLEFGDEASRVILMILQRERFDLVILGDDQADGHGHVAKSVAETAPCKVMRAPAHAA